VLFFERHLNPPKGFSRVYERDRRQMDRPRAMEKWVAIGEIACSSVISPKNRNNSAWLHSVAESIPYSSLPLWTIANPCGCFDATFYTRRLITCSHLC